MIALLTCHRRHIFQLTSILLFTSLARHSMNTASINDDNSDDCWTFVMTVRFTMRLFPDYDHQKKIFTQKSDIWRLVWSRWSIQAVLSASHNSSLKPSIASCVRIHKINPPRIVFVGGAVILSSYDFLTRWKRMKTSCAHKIVRPDGVYQLLSKVQKPPPDSGLLPNWVKSWWPGQWTYRQLTSYRKCRFVFSFINVKVS